MLLEIETLPGLKEITLTEMEQYFDSKLEVVPCDGEDTIRVNYDLSPSDFHGLRTAASIYLLLHFDIPRPNALLGHQHFHRLTGQVDRVRGMHPSGSFKTFRVGAAGKNSSVFERLKDEIAEYTHMANDPEDADLFFRVRPSQVESKGWDVLLRTTPRPLLTRSWRVCNMFGALNAAVAAAMIRLTCPQENDRFFNPMCGSGTLLIERLAYGRTQLTLGCDTNPGALDCAAQNIRAAGFENQAGLLNIDARILALPDNSFDVICTDLPWGHQIGSHDDNTELYPAVMRELTRVCAKDGRMVIITHEINLFKEVLANFADDWTLWSAMPVLQGGLHPHIYLLGRSG
jgi:23S rRNA G2445 N2-methylase RlmL